MNKDMILTIITMPRRNKKGARWATRESIIVKDEAEALQRTERAYYWNTVKQDFKIVCRLYKHAQWIEVKGVRTWKQKHG